MAMYESEHTKFMREWMAKNPQERVEQKEGRELWWDKSESLETMRRNADSKVPQKAYYYDIEG